MELKTKQRGRRSLLRLSYVSEATRRLSNLDLEEISHAAQRNNPSMGVSGMLIECAGEFLQTIEGERDAVLKLYERIEQDKRHTNATVVAARRVEERGFADWSMGCFIFTPDDLPEGFFFVDVAGRRRLRADVMERVDDVMASFYRENHDSGLARSFTEPAHA